MFRLFLAHRFYFFFSFFFLAVFWRAAYAFYPCEEGFPAPWKRARPPRALAHVQCRWMTSICHWWTDRIYGAGGMKQGYIWKRTKKVKREKKEKENSLVTNKERASACLDCATASPRFRTPRCQGNCCATTALDSLFAQRLFTSSLQGRKKIPSTPVLQRCFKRKSARIIPCSWNPQNVAGAYLAFIYWLPATNPIPHVVRTRREADGDLFYHQIIHGSLPSCASWPRNSWGERISVDPYVIFFFWLFC